MRTALKPMCEEGLEVLANMEAFAASEIQAIWTAFMEGSPRWSFSRVWSLVVLGHWMKTHQIA